jgi:AraC-like DNA-binding protein
MPFTIAVGNGSAEPTRLVCGFLGCDARPFNPLLSALPPVIRIGDRSGTTAGALAQFAMAESSEPRVGSEVMLGRLSELMFVDVVRQYLASLPAEQTGWLAGLRDDFVGRALTALHQTPARSWTLASLAREVGLSRSALAERFTHYVGHPPMQYLTNWRMQVAAAQLRSGTDTVASIADSVGTNRRPRSAAHSERRRARRALAAPSQPRHLSLITDKERT